MFRNILIILVMSILAGCAATTSPYPPVDNYSVTEAPSPSGSVSYRGHLVEGELVKISDPVFSGEVQVLVGKSYRSALGLRCYRVKVIEPDMIREPVSLCRQKDGAWYVAPRIWSRPISNVSQ